MFLGVFLLSVIFLCMLLWIYYQVKIKDVLWKMRKIPLLDENMVPVIGDVNFLRKTSGHALLSYFIDRSFELGVTCKSWIFSFLLVSIQTPEDIKAVLTSPHCFEKGSPYNVVGGDGHGLPFSKPQKWKHDRRLFNSVYGQQMIKSSMTIFNRISKDLCNDLSEKCGTGEFDMFHMVSYRVTELSFRSNVDSDIQEGIVKRCYKAFHKIFLINGDRIFNFHFHYFLANVRMFLGLPYDTKPGDVVYDELRDTLEKEKVSYLQEVETRMGVPESEEEIKKHHENFTQRIIRLVHNGLEEKTNIFEQLLSILCASTETTTTSTANIILCLAMHPEIQEKLHEEITRAVGEREDVDFEEISQMEYLARVVKEGLRVLPIVPIIGRKTSADIQIENGIIPRGTDIVIPIINVHKFKHIWGADADKFNPDHFLPENVEKRHPCSYIPFSYGPRNCIAFKYAEVFLKVCIAHLVLNYKFTTDLRFEDLEFVVHMTSTLKNGYKVSVEKRVR